MYYPGTLLALYTPLVKMYTLYREENSSDAFRYSPTGLPESLRDGQAGQKLRDPWFWLQYLHQVGWHWHRQWLLESLCLWWGLNCLSACWKNGVLDNFILKGSVQRKLRWVENGVNRSVGASDCGAGRSFVVLFRFHLGFAIFPFPVSTAQIIGKF